MNLIRDRLQFTLLQVYGRKSVTVAVPDRGVYGRIRDFEGGGCYACIRKDTERRSTTYHSYAVRGNVLLKLPSLPLGLV